MDAANPHTYVPNPTHESDPLGLAPGYVRLRHYTSGRMADQILKDGVLKASDQNKVFMVRAKGKPMSPKDAEEALGIGWGRGRAVIEFDASSASVYQVDNPLTGVREWVSDGNLLFANGVRLR